MKITENKILIILVSIVFLFNVFPYFFQHWRNPPDKIYIGSFPIYTDQATYLSEMAQGKDGHWLVLDKYTSEEQKPAPVYIFYTFLGQIARLFHSSIETIFLLSRFIFGFCLIATLIFFIRYFIKDQTQRIFTYLLAFFGSGLGWLKISHLSLDLFMPNFIPMVRFSYFPHMGFAAVLFLITIIYLLKSYQTQKIGAILIASAATFALNIILPFNSLLLYPLLFLYSSYLFKIDITKRKIYVKNFAIFFFFSIISFLYMFYIKETNPIWKIVEQQNVLASPYIYEIFLGFGLIFLWSIFGIYLMYLKKNPAAILFSLWFLLAFFLSLAPINLMPIQRRFLEMDLYIPLSITAGYAILRQYQYLKNRYFIVRAKKLISYSFLIVVLFFFIIFPGNLNNFLQFKKISALAYDNPFVYCPKQIFNAILWLKTNTPPDSIVLSSYFNGNIIPYLAQKTVYIGHGPSTIYLEEKTKKVNEFYSGAYTETKAREFLKSAGINYVFYSAYEIIAPFNPDNLNFLKKVYDQEGIGIFQVVN